MNRWRLTGRGGMSDGESQTWDTSESYYEASEADARTEGLVNLLGEAAPWLTTLAVCARARYGDDSSLASGAEKLAERISQTLKEYKE